MNYELLGWPPEGPTLRLDHEQFSYAGKFVMSSTGKAVVRDGEEIVAVVAFNDDRTDQSTLWLRYVTVRSDRRGEGIGSRLAASMRAHALELDYDRVRIAVNNPFAFAALSRAGFHATGETTGLAERILEAPGTRAEENYHDGLSAYLDRQDLSDDEVAFVHDSLDEGPPDTVDPVPLNE